MTIHNAYLKKSACYNTNAEITPRGIMVHSTATPGAMHENFLSVWDRPTAEVCPHALIDDTGIYQLLPWPHRAWHCAKSGNDTHLSFEICEPNAVYNKAGTGFSSYDVKENQAYFEKVWGYAVALCAYWCDLYKLDVSTIISHAEGYKLGIASNHADVGHWFPKHNKTMDDFRSAVKGYMAAVEKAEKEAAQPKPVRFALEIPAQTCYFNSEQEAKAAAAVIVNIKDRSGCPLKAVAEVKYK